MKTRAGFPAVLLLTFAVVLWLSPAASPARSTAASPPHLFKLYYGSPAELRQALSLLASFDLLGIDTKGKFASVLISDGDADKLRQSGYRIEVDLQHSGVQISSWSAEYYTYNRLVSDLASLADRFPSLASVHDLGPAWQTTKGLADRRIWALHITTGGQGKPQMLFDANQHAREIATPEIAIRLAKHLLEDYGRDAEVTFLVNHRDIWIVPMVNPDGHFQVEQGSSMKRKNADTDTGSCYEPYWGVDLNRNFPYGWGLDGSSSFPCDEIYSGPSPGSEPETQALMNLISANSFTFLMDYHSFGNLILWPWGYTSTPPTDSRLPATGNKLAQLTGRSGSSPYTPEQGSALYLTSGNILDWAFQTKGTLAFTTEMGSYEDWFDPPYYRVNAFWSENEPPAMYLLNIADNPNRIYGPEARGATATPSVTMLTNTITLTATISDSGNGGQAIAAAEYFVDMAGADGTGSPMSAADGAFDSLTETVQAAIPVSTIGIGPHIILVRGRDAAGNWGSLSMVFVNVNAPNRLYLPIVLSGLIGS
ncbi:MAG: M14 family metallopeptidase [Chloroflexi bacterium]|nr:M14 family metallopeptidase [Chloroflexota bacterium]